MANGNEGSTPALGDAQARKLLEAPPADTLKGVRDRAILATLLYHGIRREELCGLRVLLRLSTSFQSRKVQCCCFPTNGDSIALALCYQRTSVQMAAIRTAGEQKRSSSVGQG